MVIVDVDGERADATAKEIGAISRRVDVTDAAAVEALADWVVAELGRVDIVVNNAGVGPEARFGRMTIEDWRWIMDVNFLGVVNGVTTLLPRLRANPEGGHIVNTASMSVFFDFPGLGAYTASKQAVVGLSRVLAAEPAEEGSAVKVSVLPPGPVRTDIRHSLRHRPARRRAGWWRSISRQATPRPISGGSNQSTRVASWLGPSETTTSGLSPTPSRGPEWPRAMHSTRALSQSIRTDSDGRGTWIQQLGGSTAFWLDDPEVDAPWAIVPNTSPPRRRPRRPSRPVAPGGRCSKAPWPSAAQQPPAESWVKSG